MVIIVKGRYLQIDNMNDLYYNCVEIKNKLNDVGISVGALNNTTINRTSTAQMSPTAIITKFNQVEDNLSTLNKALPYTLKKYKKHYWENTNNIQNNVFEWVDFVNYIGGLNFTVGKLTDINGDVITDKNGDIIFTLEV